MSSPLVSAGDGRADRILEGVPEGTKTSPDRFSPGRRRRDSEGHAIYAALRSLGYPGDPRRATSGGRPTSSGSTEATHVVGVESPHGVDATEITLLTELWWRLPLNSYVGTRGGRREIAAGIERPPGPGPDRRRGVRSRRRSCGRPSRTQRTARTHVVEALGDDAEELLDLLEPWCGTPSWPLAATPTTPASSRGSSSQGPDSFWWAAAFQVGVRRAGLGPQLGRAPGVLATWRSGPRSASAAAARALNRLYPNRSGPAQAQRRCGA